MDYNINYQLLHITAPIQTLKHDGITISNIYLNVIIAGNDDVIYLKDFIGHMQKNVVFQSKNNQYFPG